MRTQDTCQRAYRDAEGRLPPTHCLSPWALARMCPGWICHCRGPYSPGWNRNPNKDRKEGCPKKMPVTKVSLFTTKPGTPGPVCRAGWALREATQGLGVGGDTRDRGWGGQGGLEATLDFQTHAQVCSAESQEMGGCEGVLYAWPPCAPGSSLGVRGEEQSAGLQLRQD